jgi:tetratricopeptide (TPR) repeat protein
MDLWLCPTRRITISSSSARCRPHTHAGSTNTVVRSLAILTGLLGALRAQPAAEHPFERDRRLLEEAVLSRDWTQSLTRVEEAVYTWRAHPEFLELAHGAVRALSSLRGDEVRREFELLRTRLTAAHPPERWLAAGLFASSAGAAREAEDCFERAERGAFSSSAFVPFLRARALLAQHRLTQAAKYYGRAVELAAEVEDPHILFSIRCRRADDLYDAGHLELAVDAARAGLDSPHALERAWTLAQLVLYSHALGDATEVEAALGRLNSLRPESITVPEGLSWQRRRLEQAIEVLRIAERASTGDDLSRMVLDVEAAEFHYKRREPERGALRLEPWTARFPLARFGGWDGETRQWAAWAHLNLHAARHLAGRSREAATGLAALADALGSHSGLEPQRVHALAWLGRALWRDGRLEDARRAMEAGLLLDAEAERAEGLPAGLDQPVVHRGRVDPELRRSYVESYGSLLREVARVSGAPEKH